MVRAKRVERVDKQALQAELADVWMHNGAAIHCDLHKAQEEEAYGVPGGEAIHRIPSSSPVANSSQNAQKDCLSM
jgi:hypothetical protein